MSSYQEILNQIEALKQQAESVRKQEMAGAISQIREIMAKYGITPADLGMTGRGAGRAKAAASVAKYRDPVSGKTWSGRGRRPSWVLDLERQGKSLDDLRI